MGVHLNPGYYLDHREIISCLRQPASGKRLTPENYQEGQLIFCFQTIILLYCFFFSPISSLDIGLAMNLIYLLLCLLLSFVLGFPSGEKHIFICCVHRILNVCSCRSQDNYELISVAQVPSLLLVSLHDSRISLISLIPPVSTEIGYNYHIWLGSI